MEHSLTQFVEGLSGVHSAMVFGLIALCLGVVGKSADCLVDEAVHLAKRSGVSTVVIGATVVSLGTTMPEAAISVFAAMQGEPGLALGNAVGSVICDTGLILGLACLMGDIPLDRRTVNRQGWIQLGSGVMLVAVTWFFGRTVPRPAGFVFLGLLGLYMWKSVQWGKEADGGEATDASGDHTALVLGRIAFAVALLILGSRILIPAVEHVAKLFGVPEDVIAATLVAFGTSLPELVTSLTAVRKGEGGLAVGNVIGADILNILFVTGAACAVTPGGLAAPDSFFKLHFPAMIAILAIFRIGIFVSGDRLKKPFGLLLLGCYGAYLFLQMTMLNEVGG
jgi:cation:H+ antiporter